LHKILSMKKTVSYLIAGIIGVAFLAACIWVYTSKGRNRKALNLKIKTGAAIIALTSLISHSCVTVTCYDVAPMNYISPLDSITENNHIFINPSNDSTVDFAIDKPQVNTITYSFNTEAGSNITSGNAIIRSGRLSVAYCEFAVPVPENISTGTYYLKVFGKNLTEVDTSVYLTSVFVDIVQE